MKLLLLGMLCILWSWAEAQVGVGYVLVPVGAAPVGVSMRRVTTLIFPTAVRAGGKRVTRDVQVEKVRGVENVLAIRATRGPFAWLRIWPYSGWTAERIRSRALLYRHGRCMGVPREAGRRFWPQPCPDGPAGG